MMHTSNLMLYKKKKKKKKKKPSNIKQYISPFICFHNSIETLKKDQYKAKGWGKHVVLIWRINKNNL